ncbi:MAG: GNAT family N-acetyltransferase [Bacillota bacterium]
MEMILWVGWGIATLLGLVALYYRNRYKKALQLIELGHENVKRTGHLLKEQEHINHIDKISIQNLKQAIHYKGLEGSNSLIRVCQLSEGQEIVVLIKVEEEHSIELQKQLQDIGADHRKTNRQIECTVFIDGKSFDPMLVSDIFRDRNSLELEDINTGNFKGRGVGTYALQHLLDVLKEIGIKKVYAFLSTVDYSNRKKLYNFYVNKNGFSLVKELTKTSNGKVEKDLGQG